MKFFIVAFILLLFSTDKRKPGNPLDNLPENILYNYCMTTTALKGKIHKLSGENAICRQQW
jgi:hypothetical protein